MHLGRQTKEMKGGPCGACKLLRRKCVIGCVFAPYFEPDERGTADFEAVHRVFGAKNVAKLLLRTPANTRLYAVISLCYEALFRIKDPVYGCVAQVFNLQQQVDNLQAQLAYVQARLSILKDPVMMTSSKGGCSLEDTSSESLGEPAALMFEEQVLDVEILAPQLFTNYHKS